MGMNVTITGGYTKKAFTVESMSITERGNTEPTTFIRVGKSIDWLGRVCLGSTARRGCFKRCRVLEILLQKCNQKHAESELEVQSAVADEESAVAVEAAVSVDPMDQLDSGDNQNGRESTPKKPRIHTPKRGREKVFIVKMPVHPPCVNLAPCETDVKMYMSGVQARTSWVASEHVGWLLCYLADEVAFGGVDAIEEESDSEANSPSPNCGVDGLHISWDFQHGSNGAWRAVFLAGPLKGNVMTAVVEELDMVKWAAVAAEGSKSFADSSYDERKEATRALLETTCGIEVDAP